MDPYPALIAITLTAPVPIPVTQDMASDQDTPRSGNAFSMAQGSHGLVYLTQDVLVSV